MAEYDLPDNIPDLTGAPAIPDLPVGAYDLPDNLPDLTAPSSEIKDPEVKPDGTGEYADSLGREGKLSQGLNYGLNAALTGLKDSAIAHGKGGGYGAQFEALVSGAKAGLKKERATSMADLMKTMAGLQDKGETLLPIYKNLGDDDGKFQAGDIPDELRNFILSAGVDPLSYAAGPILGTAGKGISKVAGGAAKVLPEQSMAQLLAKRVTPRVGAATAGGAFLGGAMTGRDDSDVDMLANMAKGGALLGGMGVVGKPLAQVMKKGTDSFADSAAVWLKGEKFAGISAAKELAGEGSSKIRSAYVDMIQNYAEKFTGIKPKAELAAGKVNEVLKTEFIRRREFALAQYGDAPISPVFKNKLNETIAADMHADGTVAKALQGQAESTVEAYNATKSFNEDMVKKINQDVYGQASGDWNRRTGQGIAGIPFHIEDLRPLESMKAVDEAFQAAKNVGPLKMAKSLERGVSREALGARGSKELYLKKMATNWATKEERKAMQLIGEYRGASGGELDKILHTFDRSASFMKFNMLAASSSWLRNNYPDNITKAYHQAGLLGAFDAATMGVFKRGLWGDIGNIMKGDLTKPLKNEYTKAMTKRGILDTNIGGEVTDDIAHYYMTPEKIAEKAAKKPGLLGKVVMLPYFPVQKLGDLVMHVGSRMESSAKATTFIRAMENIKADKTLFKRLGQDGAEKAAADIVNNTFFDYSDVSEFERMFAKRMVPFYTFFKKNAQYYADAFQNPKMYGRLAQGNRIRDFVGQGPSSQPLTTEQDAGMPDYIKRGDPRSLGMEGDRLKVMFSPSNSMMDAYSMLAPGISNLAVEKSNPLIKTPVELLTDQDTFTKDAMYPSSLNKNEKHLFGAGHAHLAVKNTIEQFIPKGPLRDLVETAAGVAGVRLDKKGNPVSTEDSQVIIDRLSPLGINSTLWPKPLLKQYYGSMGKIDSKKLTPEDVLNNLVNTHQITGLSSGQRDYEVKRNEDVKKAKNKKKYQDKP